MKNDSEVLLTFGTTLSIKHVGPKDVNDESLIYLDFADWAKQPLIDWIVKNEQSPGNEVVEELN